MKFELGLLQTRVARRLLFLFILCALLPIGVLVALSHRHITRHFEEQGEIRLGQTAGAVVETVKDRLWEAERELTLVAGIEATGAIAPSSRGSFYQNELRTITAASLVRSGSRPRPVYGILTPPDDLDRRHVEHLHAGRTVLVERVVQKGDSTEVEILMGRRGDPSRARSPMIWARLDTNYLWSGVAALGTRENNGSLAIVDPELRTLFGEDVLASGFRDKAVRTLDGAQGGSFKWTEGENLHRAVLSPIDMGDGYLMPTWHAVVSQSQSALMAPIRDFTTSFLPLALSALLIVLLLSDAQIKRTTYPLTRLREATRRIEEQDFDGHVDVSSRDEFQDLAESFNSMTQQLGAQIRTLSAINQVDRTALTASAPTEIVDALLEVLLEVVPCEAVAICLLSPLDIQKGRSYGKDIAARPLTLKVNTYLTNADLALIREYRDHLGLTAKEDPIPAFAMVPPFCDVEYDAYLILPIILDGEPAGAITYARGGSEPFTESEILRSRQVADQAALALSNVRRLADLEQLNWGTLTALARAIDAASAWTAGHSERVAKLAAQVGELMNLEDDALESLRRGALLHDIGKIGVGIDLVNKTGPLTEGEAEAVREHVNVGARILEPIASYADLIPIVQSHHERFDGKGYPKGVSGEEIDLRARILAVADTFDALTSDRPYRQGLPMKTAIEVVRNASGTQFDPEVVEAFFRLVDKGDMDFQPVRLRSDGTVSKPEDHQATSKKVLARLTGAFEI